MRDKKQLSRGLNCHNNINVIFIADLGYFGVALLYLLPMGLKQSLHGIISVLIVPNLISSSVHLQSPNKALTPKTLTQ